MKKEELLALIQDALELQEAVAEGDSVDTLEAWDSLGQLQILLRLDQATGGEASSIEELGGATSVAKLMEILAANGHIDG